MNYLKQILFELRERPLVTWITISGTALSLFLLMAVYMVNRVETIQASPESRRDRLMVAPFIHLRTEGGEYAGSMSTTIGKKLYENIPGVENVSYAASWTQTKMVSYNGIDPGTYSEKRVDDEFWKIFDFEFISGSPFTKSEVDAGIKEVILSESVARELGNGANLLGQEIFIDYIPHKVKGIVRDPNPLLHNAWGQIWIAWKEDASDRWSEECGETHVYLLLAPGTSMESIKKEVERRYAVYNSQFASQGKEIFYHGSPFTVLEMTSGVASNRTPETEGVQLRRFLLYAILLLLPAINLSGMTRSRLQRRVSEIGVRRAFGATRFKIISQLIGENFLLSLFGGFIGLILCMAFLVFFSNLFINYIEAWSATAVQAAARPDFSMLFSWNVFLVALLFCFILNLISTGIPAWKATRVNPAEAISGKKN